MYFFLRSAFQLVTKEDLVRSKHSDLNCFVVSITHWNNIFIIHIENGFQTSSAIHALILRATGKHRVLKHTVYIHWNVVLELFAIMLIFITASLVKYNIRKYELHWDYKINHCSWHRFQLPEYYFYSFLCDWYLIKRQQCYTLSVKVCIESG